jgi:ribosome-binding factor A
MQQYTQRQMRVGEQVRQVLAQALQEHVFYEPELEGVSITVSEVRMSPDLKNARTYVAPLGKPATKEFMKTLQSYAFLFQKDVARNLKLRFTPRIYFVEDASFEKAAHMESIFSLVSAELPPEEPTSEADGSSSSDSD